MTGKFITVNLFVLALLSCMFVPVELAAANDVSLENDRYIIGIISKATDSNALDLRISITDKHNEVTSRHDTPIIFTTGTEIKDAFFVTESAFMAVFYYHFNNGMLLSSVSEDGKLAKLQFRVGKYALDPAKRVMVHSNWGDARQYIEQIDIAGTIEALNNTNEKGKNPSEDIIVDRLIFDVFKAQPDARIIDIKWAGEDTFEVELAERDGKQYKYYKYLISGVTPKSPDAWGDVTIKQIPYETE